MPENSYDGGIKEVVRRTFVSDIPSYSECQFDVFKTPDDLIKKLISSLTDETKQKDFGSLARLLELYAKNARLSNRNSVLR